MVPRKSKNIMKFNSKSIFNFKEAGCRRRWISSREQALLYMYILGNFSLFMAHRQDCLSYKKVYKCMENAWVQFLFMS